MKVLFATTNPAKINRYLGKLQEKGIEVLTLKDIDLNLHVEETGKNAIENSYIKAKAYYDATKITTIGMDNNLFIKELSEERKKDHFYFIDKSFEKRTPGYPLDSISIMPKYNKYFVDLTPEEKNKNVNNKDDVIDFIMKSLEEK